MAVARNPLTILVCLVLAAVHAAAAEDQYNIEKDGMCIPGMPDVPAEVSGGSTTLAFFDLWRPVTLTTAPNYLIIVLIVWIFLGASLRGTRTEQDDLSEDRRARQVMDQVAQVVYEHWKVETELHEYEARDLKLQEMARQQRASGSNIDIKLTPEYQDLIVETGFADTYGPDNPKPVRLAPHRVIDAMVDEIDQCPVSKIAPVLSKLKGEELRTFVLLFREAYCIMLLRINTKLDDIMKKTKEARAKHAGNAAYSALVTGSKLIEILDTAKDLNKGFFKRRLYGLLPPPDIDNFGVVEEDEATRERHAQIMKTFCKVLPPSKDLEVDFKKKLRSAKALMKEIDALKGGILAKVLGYCETVTLINMTLVISTRLMYAVVGPIHQTLIVSILDNAYGDSWAQNALNGCIAWMAVGIMCWWVCDFINIVCEAKATQSITRKLRNNLFQAIMRQDTIFFETHETGWIQDRLKRDCDELSRKILMFPVHMFSDLLQIVAKSIFLAYYCPHMTLNALSVGLISAVPMIIMQNCVHKRASRSDRFVSRMNAKTDELLNNLSTVREFARENQETVEFEHAEKNKAEASLLIHAMRHAQWPIIITILALGYLMNVYEGAKRINMGELKPTDVVMIVGETWCIIWHCKSIVEKFPELLELLLPAERVFRLLEQQSAVEPMPGDERVPFKTESGDGEYNGGIEIEFEDVSFAYPTMPEHPVLRGMRCRIPAGKTVSFVGERGCGKSTTFELIQRKYNVEPDHGLVRVNGRPIAEWDLRQYRRHLSIVAQSPKVFTNTIKENILYGLSDQERLERGFDGPEASTQGFLELKRICELACCWDFIKDFPLQLETRIGTKGIKLSGGQTQCLTIARALIKNPACLILDEATAALDNETQKRVSQNIGTLQRQQGFTVIQIAHRLTTLTNSDIIYFLRHGVVVESGGCEKQDGTAVQELNKIEIIHKLVKNPETNEEEQRVTQGFFHHHWNVANDVQSFHELTSKQLLSKIRELRDDLDMAQAEIKSKNLKRLLPPLVLERALTSPSGDHVVGEQLDNFMKLAKSAEKVSSFENLDTESSCRVAPTIPHTLPAGKSVLAKWPISLDRAASG